MNNVPAGPGTRIKLNFKLSLVTGELIDSTDATPATFDVGDGSLLPGFEAAMFGMKAGDKGEIKIPAEHGFGLPNEDNVHILKRQEFSSELELEEGLVVSFADGDDGDDGDDGELPGVVTRLLGEVVEVDFNHPLAGRELVFWVEIIEVEQVTDEILRV